MSTQALIDALKAARPYVEDAYEPAFPDEAENEKILADIDKALAQQAQEPVYQVRNKYGGWDDIDKAAYEQLGSREMEHFRILYTTPPSPQAPGRRKGPPGITLEPQSHEQPAVPEWLNSAFPNSGDLHALGLTVPTPAQFAQQLHKRWKAKLEKVEEELCALKATNAPQPAVPVVSGWSMTDNHDGSVTIETPEGRIISLHRSGGSGMESTAYSLALLAMRPSVEPMTPEQWCEVLGTAGVDLLELAKMWSDNKIHVYQFTNEAEKIVKAAVLRGITAKAEGGA